MTTVKPEWEAAMRAALAIQAAESVRGDDVPVGAVLLDDSGNIVASGHNEKERHSDPTAHAEIVAIRAAAAARSDWRLDDLTLVVTLEPCVMCAAAIVAARIPRVVFGAWDDRVGGAGSLYDLLRDARLGKPVEVVGGVLEVECASELKEFFARKRQGL